MAEMTGLERALCYLAGEKPDKIPIWHQSVDLSRELLGVSMKEFASDPEKVALGHIKYVEKYKVDVCGVNTDMFWPYEPFGVEVYITDLLIYPKKTLADRRRPDPKVYKELEYRDPFAGDRAKVVLKANEIVARELGDKILFRQGWYGPVASLALVVGVKEALRDVVLFPEAFFDAVKRVMIDWTVDFFVRGFEVWKPHITNICWGMATFDRELLPVEFREEVVKLEVEALERIREEIGWDVPVTTHICGPKPDLDFIVRAFGEHISELQFWWPGSDYTLEEAVEKFGDRLPIMAGIDHTKTLLMGTPEEVDAMVKNSIEIAKDRCSFALGPGCDLGLGTPEENILALVEARDKYGMY
jgi:uroporphyrinogen-III decarboxylase